MKLYVWENVLCDYSEGIVCVYAESEEAAWDKLKEYDHSAWLVLRGDPRGIDKRSVEELKKDEKVIRPRCVTNAEAFVVWGGG